MVQLGNCHYNLKDEKMCFQSWLVPTLSVVITVIKIEKHFLRQSYDFEEVVDMISTTNGDQHP